MGNLVSNDVVTSGIYHKLGYRGCPIVQLSLGDKSDCRRWLVGDAHSRLKYMFLFTMRYFYKYELPKTPGLAKRLKDDDHLTVTMKTEFFED